MNQIVRNISSVLFFFVLAFFLNSCAKEEDDPIVDPVPTKTDLEKAKEDYQANYLGTASITLNWTGTLTGCVQGDIDAKVRENVVKRVNYFRRLVGLSDNITINETQNVKCQQAALYMVSNQTITHYPTSSGSCYTAEAADAAGHGNLAISYGSSELAGNHSVNAVTGYIQDKGSNNLAVGHRHWVLLPGLRAIGEGSVYHAATKWSADCMMWGYNYVSSGTTPGYVAYPPNGYIPSVLVFPRWSFSIAGANFNNATVQMWDKNNNVINLTVIHRETFSGFPDSRIVWEPAGNFPGDITADTDYKVTISNLTGTAQSSYTYTVKVFKVSQSSAFKILEQENGIDIVL